MYRAALLLVFPFVATIGCREPAPRPVPAPPPANVQPTNIDYVDSDGFDALFESALVNQDPVIVIHTGRVKPDWDGRLNAWIAAWNRGGPVTIPHTARGQIPGVNLDEGTLREFRLLVGSFLDRADDVARDGTVWWAEERTRSRRITLLKPYDLRFHIGEDRNIDLVLFNGNYASYYPDFVQNLTGAATENDEPHQWVRTFRCSRCKVLNDKANAAPAPDAANGAE